MSSDDYRSYVIRVRRRGPDGSDPGADTTTRLDVEDLLAGGTATVSGEPARSFADSLERLVDAGRQDVPVPSAPVADPVEEAALD